VSVNITLPDITSVDPIVDWIRRNALDADVMIAGTELIGVIRQKDLLQATHLPVKPAQVVDRVKNEV